MKEKHLNNIKRLLGSKVKNSRELGKVLLNNSDLSEGEKYQIVKDHEHKPLRVGPGILDQLKYENIKVYKPLSIGQQIKAINNWLKDVWLKRI